MNKRRFLFPLLALAAACSSTDNAAEKTDTENSSLNTVAVTIGTPVHVWNTETGGVVWLSSKTAAKQHASFLGQQPGDVFLDLKENEQGFGYRFDTNYFEPTTPEHAWFDWDGTDNGSPTTLDDYFQIYGKPNVKFILNVPIPKTTTQTPNGEGTGVGFTWQTPAFYGAQMQYLFGNADASSVYSTLPTSIDFFSQPASFNWANLRARRGHPAPYAVEAILLGEEPYVIEGWQQDGAGFGAAAERYRAAIRARGINIPYGLHVSQLPPTDTARPWFFQMLSAMSPSDPPKYLDLYHYYSYAGTEDWDREFPITTNPNGFQNWWLDKSTWKSDYTKYLWLVEDTKHALEMAGRNPADYKLGWSEHGIHPSSQFTLNDMKAGLHWASWLTETMRLNTSFDSMWVYGAEGYSNAQVQYYNGVNTRTPAFYVYEMAKKFQGLTYLDTQTASAIGTTTNPDNSTVNFPWLVVRAFSDSQGRRNLFVVNHHPTQPMTLTGLTGWQIGEWEELVGANYASQNTLGVNTPETVHSVIVPKDPNAPLTVSPVSVTRIVLQQTGTTTTPPPADAGTGTTCTSTNDAGSTAPVDSGTTSQDAGAPPQDAGSSPVDSGTTSADAGTTSPDSGTTSTDAGTSGVVFSDDFESGSTSQWNLLGSFSVCQPQGASKELCKTSTTDGLALAGTSSLTDYTAQSYIRFDQDAGGVALLARVQDSTHYYQLELKHDGAGNKVWGLWKNNGGSWTYLNSGTFNYVVPAYYLLKLGVHGTQITASISSDFGTTFTNLGSGTDSQYTHGQIGVRAYGNNAHFDGVRVTVP